MLKCCILTLGRGKMENKRLTVEIPEDLHAEAKSKAYGEGKTLKEKIIDLLRDWLRK